MKSKYDITNLLKTKPMNAEECARIMIADIHEETDFGKGFLSQEEIVSIRDGKMDNAAYYNELIDIDHNMQLMAINSHQRILNYKILTQHLKNILESYINAMYQEDVIGCVEWIESKNKKMNKTLNVLKSTLKHIFRLSSIYAYLHDKEKDLRWEDLGKVHINNSREVIMMVMKKRRIYVNSVLAYKELIAKGCEKTKINYYLENLNASLEGIEKEDISLNSNLNILHNHFTRKGEYDGFLKKEMDIEVKATYGDEHKSFLENQ